MRLFLLNSIQSSDGWDWKLAIEDVAAWFGQQDTPAAAWRAAVCAGAASKSSRARAASDLANTVFDPELLVMKAAYQRLVQARYPQLIATDQQKRDREYYLGAQGLPKGIRFKHHFFTGEVSLILEKKWVAAAGDWLEANMPQDARVKRFTSEMHVRIPTEILDPALPLEEQEDVAVKALDTVCRLVSLAEAVAHV